MNVCICHRDSVADGAVRRGEQAQEWEVGVLDSSAQTMWHMCIRVPVQLGFVCLSVAGCFDCLDSTCLGRGAYGATSIWRSSYRRPESPTSTLAKAAYIHCGRPPTVGETVRSQEFARKINFQVPQNGLCRTFAGWDALERPCQECRLSFRSLRLISTDIVSRL